MELTEDEIIQKCAKHCGHCRLNTLVPYEYEWSCVSCCINLIKRKHELKKIQRKKLNFINRLKYPQHKFFWICIEVYEIYEGDDYDKLYEVLSTLKSKKIKINNIFIEKYKDMLENPDFEKNH